MSAPSRSCWAVLAELAQAGYVAVRGVRAIGPPEGPPADDRFKALLLRS